MEVKMNKEIRDNGRLQRIPISVSSILLVFPRIPITCIKVSGMTQLPLSTFYRPGTGVSCKIKEMEIKKLLFTQMPVQ